MNLSCHPSIDPKNVAPLGPQALTYTLEDDLLHYTLQTQFLFKKE